MYILGISAFYHDSAACLLANDKIIAAAQEERFTRIKNDAQFPARTIIYCLQKAGISLAQVNHIVFYEKPFLKFERIIESHFADVPFGFAGFLKAIPLWLKSKLFQKRDIIKALQQIDKNWLPSGDNLLFTHHHQSHAASAFFPSPFHKSIIVSLDGVGEWTTTSVWQGNGNKINLLKEIQFPHSVGLLYSAFTYYLGFKVNSDEYKVMGLAPYGQPKYADLILDKIIDLKRDGSFRLNMKYFNYTSGLTMTNKRFDQLFNAKRRNLTDAITSFHMDVASSIQYVTEKVVLSIIDDLSDNYPECNICLAGGVALNCVVNGKILNKHKINRLWIQPAAGDAGGALGAAYYVYHHHLNMPRVVEDADKMEQALLGPDFTTHEVIEALDKRELRYTVYNQSDFYQRVATYIDEGYVVGWFSGRMEFGPRALGSRSILADCRDRNMQRKLNLKVKFRESFRPFAPAILEDKLTDYFNLKQSSPYMLLVDKILEKHRKPVCSNVTGFNQLQLDRSIFPAVTHVDYSSRIQTVNEQNGTFFLLLQAFYRLTNCPAIINTSFNVKDEPIVCRPQDAIECFLKTNIDVLAIENIIVMKENIPEIQTAQ